MPQHGFSKGAGLCPVRSTTCRVGLENAVHVHLDWCGRMMLDPAQMHFAALRTTEPEWVQQRFFTKDQTRIQFKFIQSIFFKRN